MFEYDNMWLLYHVRGLQFGKYAKDAGAGFSGVVNVNVIGTGERYSAYLLETAAPGHTSGRSKVREKFEVY